MNLFGELVNHKSFGKGQIVEVTDKHIKVLFNDFEEEKLFQYPTALGLYLELDNESLMKEINDLMNHADIKKTEVEKNIHKEYVLNKPQNKLEVLHDERNVERNFFIDIADYNILFDNYSDNSEKLLQIKKEKKEKIKTILKQRNIKYLVHFTRLDNLTSILNYGLIPVSLQKDKNIISVHNDVQRFDSQLDCTSCSVGFPNYKLFYKFRVINSPGTKWVVIVLDTDILFSLDNISYFCNTNAARVFPNIINVNELCTADAFENMFYEGAELNNRINFRKDLEIESYLTTDPQAEILISNIIDYKYIKNICFQNEYDKDEFIHTNEDKLINKFKLNIYPTFFERRNDFMFWK